MADEEGGGRREHLPKDFDMDEEEASLEEVCAGLGTDLCFGLSREAAAARLARDGRNGLRRRGRGSRCLRFLRCLFGGTPAFLWTLASVCALVQSLFAVAYGEVDLVVVFLICTAATNAVLIGVCLYLQGKRSKTLASVLPTPSPETEVFRDGKRVKIPTEEVVVGDLVLLRFGEAVPADVRLTESQNFHVDNSVATGLMMTQQLESPNIAYCGSRVVEGTARGIVVRTGQQTLLGRTLAARKETDLLLCPVTRKVAELLERCSAVSAVLAFCLFLFFWLLPSGRPPAEAAVVAVLLALAILPEDVLPAMLIAVRIYCRKMSTKSCNMRSILAIQRIPFVKTICLNKPGILTVNKMNVANLWIDRRVVKVWGGTKMAWKERMSPTFKEFGRCAVLANEAVFKDEDEDELPTKRQMEGSPSDVAVLRFLVGAMGRKAERLREAHPKLLRSTGKFKASVHRSNGAALIVLTGEPEHLLERCSAFLMTGNPQPISSGFVQEVDRVCVQFASHAQTIKCVAAQTMPLERGNFDPWQFKLPETGFVFLGIVALSDSPRSNITQAIVKCKQAGIRVVLMTNEHPIAARSFARSIGVISEQSQTLEEKFEDRGDDAGRREVNAVVVDGLQLKRLSMKAVQALMARYPEVVFARASPTQKLMLVATCQQSSPLVAFVGDGVHDALSMRKADLSVTLTDGDVDRSQVNADVCLTDDTFYSLATCIEEGRTIYENLKKCAAFSLTSTVPAALSVAAYCLLGLPLPFHPVGLVLVGSLLDLFPAVALAFERGDPGLMNRPPRDLRSDRLWSRQMVFYGCAQIGVIETFACFFTYFVIMQEYGWSPLALVGIRDRWDSRVVTDLEDSYGQKWSYEARKNLENLCQTGYFFALVLVQVANVIVCKNQSISLRKIKDRNWLVHFGLLFELSIVFFLIYLPQVNDFAGLQPLRPIWWLLPVPYLFFIILYDEVKKYIVRRSPAGWFARETLY